MVGASSFNRLLLLLGAVDLEVTVPLAASVAVADAADVADRVPVRDAQPEVTEAVAATGPAVAVEVAVLVGPRPLCSGLSMSVCLMRLMSCLLEMMEKSCRMTRLQRRHSSLTSWRQVVVKAVRG